MGVPISRQAIERVVPDAARKTGPGHLEMRNVAPMVLVGILLVSGLALVVVESVGNIRGGYGSKFWQLPLDEKLDHVAQNRWAWWWLSIWELVGLFTMTGGVVGFVQIVTEEGEGVLAHVALGGYLVALIAWLFGLTIQSAAVSRASAQRADTGETPAWLQPLWDAAYLSEGVWIVGSNLAYAVLGAAVVRSEVVGTWAGWAAIGLGILIPVVVLSIRDGFPQLGYLSPTLLGIAVLIAAS